MKYFSIANIILFFLFIATGLSFLDRQVLSMTIIKIQKAFHMTDLQYGWVNTSFLISYALMFTLGGRLMDRVGGKIGMAISLGVWSLANGLHGFMTNFYQLITLRFLLGMGEGGCFPGAAKIVYEWFDEKKRALANGVAIGGSAIGAVVAPPLVIWISTQFGWRWSFIISGLIGMAWLIGWLCIPWKDKNFRAKRGKHPKSGAFNRQRDNSINSAKGDDKPDVSRLGNAATKKAIPLVFFLKNRKALVFIIIRFLLDPVLYFIMFWTPKYLHEQRGIPFEDIGNLFWIPFLGLGIANIIGGWCADLLVRKGLSINRSRKIVMGIAAALTMVAPFIAFVSTVQMAIFMITLVTIAHGFWVTNYITATSDVFGSEGTATVVGLSGTAGAIAGLLVSPLIGLVIQSYSYTPIWIISGVMYPAAFILLLTCIPKLAKLPYRSERGTGLE